MNTEIDLAESFTDEPPFGVVPFSEKTLMLCNRALRYAGLQAEDADFIGAYICISRQNYKPTEAQVLQAYLDTDEDKLREIMDYMVRVQKRRTAAAVEVAETPGKPQE
jgi:hypothetical protein